MILARCCMWTDLPIKIGDKCANWYQLRYTYTFFHNCLPLQSHMLNSLLVKEFFTKIYTACTDTPSNNCNSSYLIRVGPGHRQSASDSRESSRLQKGAGWHYSSDRRVQTAPLKTAKEGVVRAREEKSGRSLVELSVCGDEEWEGGKVNMGHSSGLRHVLPSGWKRKWLGPITAFFFFFFLPFCLQLISLLMRRSLLTGFQLSPMSPTVTTVSPKKPGQRKGLKSISIDVFPSYSSGDSRCFTRKSDLYRSAQKQWRDR